LARYVSDRLDEIGFDLLFQDQVGNVVAMLVGSEDEPTVLLSSHMDTAEPSDHGPWINDPFSGNLDRHRIHALGASAAKSGIAAQLYASYLLKDTTAPLRGNLVVAVTVAQGDGYCAGARHLIEKTLPDLSVRPDVAILGEPTDLAAYAGHRGWVDVDLTVTGTDTRSTQTATDLICRFLYPPTVDERLSSFKGMRISGPRYRFHEDSAEATIRIRRAVDVGDTVETAVHRAEQRVRVSLGDLSGISLEAKVHEERQRFYTGRSIITPHSCEAWACDNRGGLLDRVRDVLTDVGLNGVASLDWKPERADVGTAGGILKNEHRIPTIIFGPGDIECSETPQESVIVKKLVDGVAGTAALVWELIGVESIDDDSNLYAQSAANAMPPPICP
jgi:acetylornithine deacetylase